VARYLIQSPHTKEECLQALDDILAEGPDMLARYDFGCVAGDHTGYATIDARSEDAAREFVPALVRNKARITEVGKFTPEQIRSFHDMK